MISDIQKLVTFALQIKLKTRGSKKGDKDGPTQSKLKPR